MNGKRIRVIKRAERSLSRAASERRSGVRTLLKAKRDAVAVVTGWVNEFHQQKDEELANGFANLFGQGDVKVANN